jgi:hypothetical protein
MIDWREPQTRPPDVAIHFSFPEFCSSDLDTDAVLTTYETSTIPNLTT